MCVQRGNPGGTYVRTAIRQIHDQCQFWWRVGPDRRSGRAEGLSVEQLLSWSVKKLDWMEILFSNEKRSFSNMILITPFGWERSSHALDALKAAMTKRTYEEFPSSNKYYIPLFLECVDSSVTSLLFTSVFLHSRFFCQGVLLSGPDRGQFRGALVLIATFSVLYFAFV